MPILNRTEMGYLDTNTLDMSKKEHRHLVLQIALKCADISNPCRPWEISRKWSLKVCEEFFRQGDYERKLNLPVTALCDRHTTSIPKIQTGFFKFVVTPLISEWHRFLQNDLSNQMISNLLFNQNKWDMLVAQEMAEETQTEISDADMVDDDLDTNVSDSSELLLPLRRSSLNPARPGGGLKEHLRRFSVPLNVFQDSKYKNRDRTRTPSVAEPRFCGNSSPLSSEHSLHSQLSVRGHCEHGKSSEKQLSTEKLLPDSSIASITTPMQATRLNTVLKDGGTCKLIRQQTFPPLETAARAHALAARPMHTSNEDAIYPCRHTKTEIGPTFDTIRKDGRFSNMFKKYDTDKTDTDDASENNNLDITECSRSIEKENLDPSIRSAGGGRRDSLGSQLRDNLSAVPLGARASAQLAARRKSMPTDIISYAPKEKKMREVTTIPEFLRRTLSVKEYCERRRGSAPAPVAASELRGLATLGAPRHSVNGASRRKASTGLACHQWLAKPSYSLHERTLPHLPRRSSLPVEVMTVEALSQSRGEFLTDFEKRRLSMKQFMIVVMHMVNRTGGKAPGLLNNERLCIGKSNLS
ncbi:hypothetical protein MSG28_000775 [Choristoneura fumiferana]|uniref:Uncharacterized protein n=1 Tax=Choristoneura fumiferana TaxID=7141 RepID=A0ACC0K2T5_CHOFU|nr:hypothetical protein MSG28_000775 [Choristoneura fumiferana]